MNQSDPTNFYQLNPNIPQLYIYPQKESDTETLYISKFIQKRQELGAVAFSCTWNLTPRLPIMDADRQSHQGQIEAGTGDKETPEESAKAKTKLVLGQFLTKIGFNEREEAHMLDYFFDVSDMRDDHESYSGVEDHHEAAALEVENRDSGFVGSDK